MSDHSGKTTVENFAHALLRGGKPSSPALLAGEQSLSFQQLREAVERYASALRAAGLVSGDRVILLADNGFFGVIVYLAVMRAGGVIVPLAPAAGEVSTEYQVRITGAKLAFVQKKFIRRFSASPAVGVLDKIWVDDPLPRMREPFVHISELEAMAASEAAELPITVKHDALASIVFTSGSTGQPRGVMVLHRNLLANTRSICQYLPMGPGDRAMLVLPLCYCYGASVLHTHLFAGGAVVLMGFMFPEKVLQELERKQCTALYGVPSTFQLLLRKSTFRDRALPDLRFFAQAGGRLSNVFIEEIQRAFPDVEFFTMYGQTEATARLSYLPPRELDRKRGSIGSGIPGVTLRLLDKNDNAVAVGEVGEIVAEGDNVTAGYWQDPDNSAEYFRDGRLYTGDMAIADEDGYLFIRDRKRDFIKVGGIRVGSKEVEDTIAELESVVEVAVVGLPDDVLGEAITAVIVPTKEGAIDASEVAKHCRLRLHGEKVPKTILVVPRLPKNEAGKILKAKLREELQRN